MEWVITWLCIFEGPRHANWAQAKDDFVVLVGLKQARNYSRRGKAQVLSSHKTDGGINRKSRVRLRVNTRQPKPIIFFAELGRRQGGGEVETTLTISHTILLYYNIHLDIHSPPSQPATLPHRLTRAPPCPRLSPHRPPSAGGSSAPSSASFSSLAANLCAPANHRPSLQTASSSLSSSAT